MSERTITALSLCASAGVGETYLDKLNINVVVANELKSERAAIYSRCYPSCKMIVGSIQDEAIKSEIIKEAKDRSVELIFMTLPCQGFSVAGKKDSKDPRNSLFLDAFQIAQEVQPQYILLENVPQFKEAHHVLDNGVKRKIKDSIAEMMPDYTMRMDVLNAAHYDTPQCRRRCFLLMSHKNVPVWTFPGIVTPAPITIRDAIGHLPSLESGETAEPAYKYHTAPRHNERHILWMKHTPSGKSAFENEEHFPQRGNGERIKAFKTAYKRMDPDKACPTITMSSRTISSQNNTHYGRRREDGTYSDARALTLLELILLTGLPSNWPVPTFCSQRCARDILGECVPPKLMYHICKNNPLIPEETRNGIN